MLARASGVTTLDAMLTLLNRYVPKERPGARQMAILKQFADSLHASASWKLGATRFKFGPSSGAIPADGPAMRPVGEHGSAPSLYFAYGSNLHRDDMAARCPGSVPLRRLKLKDWMLAFRFYADIVPSPGRVVEGALYSVTSTDVAALDEYEGLSEGLYRRQTLVLDGTGEEIFFYVMKRGDVALPSEAYLDIIKTGFANWHIPLDTLTDAVSRANEDLRIGRIPG